MEPLLPFFEWADRTAVGATIRASTWLFPFIETIHILALTLLFGTVLVVDLRLLDAGLVRQPLSRVTSSVRPWMTGSLVVILITGVLLFLSEALKCYGNVGFEFKMICLALALVFHFTAFARTSAGAGSQSPAVRKMVAVVSMALWLGVGVGGRAIGFV